jgi:hypothetical protein
MKMLSVASRETPQAAGEEMRPKLLPFVGVLDRSCPGFCTPVEVMTVFYWARWVNSYGFPNTTGVSYLSKRNASRRTASGYSAL